MRRFANSFCPVCTHTLSFVLNDLRRSFAPNHLICRLKCTESAPKIGSDAPEVVAMLRPRGLQETSNQDLRPFRRARRVEQLLSALPHLLRPHRAIETFAPSSVSGTAALYNSP